MHYSRHRLAWLVAYVTTFGLLAQWSLRQKISASILGLVYFQLRRAVRAFE